MKLYAYIGVGLVALFVFGEGLARYQSAKSNAQEGLRLAQAQTETLMAQRQDLLQQKAEAEIANTNVQMLWTGSGDGPPIGELQSALAVLAKNAGTDLKSIYAEEPQLIGSVDVVRLTLEVEADTESWQMLMREIHQNSPVILPVSSEMRRLNRTDPMAAYPQTLVRLTLDFPYVDEGAL